eukprot:scaffold109264_cov62-Phaeocystis_antarctica.AAC.3
MVPRTAALAAPLARRVARLVLRQRHAAATRAEAAQPSARVRRAAAVAVTEEALLQQQGRPPLPAALRPQPAKVRDRHLLAGGDGALGVVAHLAALPRAVPAVGVAGMVGHRRQREQRHAALEGLGVGVADEQQLVDELEDAWPVVLLSQLQSQRVSVDRPLQPRCRDGVAPRPVRNDLQVSVDRGRHHVEERELFGRPGGQKAAHHLVHLVHWPAQRRQLSQHQVAGLKRTGRCELAAFAWIVGDSGGTATGTAGELLGERWDGRASESADGRRKGGALPADNAEPTTRELDVGPVKGALPADNTYVRWPTKEEAADQI